MVRFWSFRFDRRLNQVIWAFRLVAHGQCKDEHGYEHYTVELQLVAREGGQTIGVYELREIGDVECLDD